MPTHYTFRQDPGSFNSLGSIRINFPSPFGVYMHDTPLKNLFGEDFRFHSSGCMRVQNVRQLVVWLFDGTQGLGRPRRSNEAIKSGEQKNANLTKPVPLHWVYVTAWSASDGIVQFREDIYSRDGLGGPAIPADGQALGIGPQATRSVFWHGGFPLFALGYVFFPKQVWVDSLLHRHAGSVIACSVVCIVGLVVGLTLLATIGHDILPTIIKAGDYSLLISTGVSPAIFALECHSTFRVVATT